MTSNASLLIAAVVLVFLLALYGYVTLSRFETVEMRNTGVANPASENCVQNGGRIEIVSDVAGAQAGYCRMTDGRVCEKWALFRDGSCVAPR